MLLPGACPVPCCRLSLTCLVQNVILLHGCISAALNGTSLNGFYEAVWALGRIGMPMCHTSRCSDGHSLSKLRAIALLQPCNDSVEQEALACTAEPA